MLRNHLDPQYREVLTGEDPANLQRSPVSGKRSNRRSALDNPFATRHVAPGMIPYFFAAEEDRHQIITRADAALWTGQIVGPHGSGKTTLVRHLSPQLQERFAAIEFLIVRGIGDVQFCQPLGGASLAASNVEADMNERTLYVIDGIERLSWLQRRLLIADCRRKQISLLVTAHRRLRGLPVFYETSFDETRFEKIMAHLGTAQYKNHFSSLRNIFGDNCRDILFELYDDHLRSVEH